MFQRDGCRRTSQINDGLNLPVGSSTIFSGWFRNERSADPDTRSYISSPCLG